MHELEAVMVEMKTVKGKVIIHDLGDDMMTVKNYNTRESVHI